MHVPVLVALGVVAVVAVVIGLQSKSEGCRAEEAPPSNIALSMDSAGISCARRRTLHFIRHAQGYHNWAEDRSERRQLHLRNESHIRLFETHGRAWVLLEQTTGIRYHDPRLTTKGRLQAAALRSQLRKAGVSFDAVAVSPMRRTLQTAFLGIPQLQKKRYSPTIPVYTTDLLRERVANYTSDGRKRIGVLRKEWPGVHWAGMDEDDLLFLNHKENGPDEPERLRTRAHKALQWLSSLPDEHVHIAVVSHQHLLRALLGLADVHKNMHNAECVEMVLCESPEEADHSHARDEL